MINSINNFNQNNVTFKQNLSEPKQPQGKFKEFGDHFVTDMKKTLPLSAIMGAAWSLFDVKKGKTALLNSLISNVALFASANVAVAAVNAAFKTNRKKPQ